MSNAWTWLGMKPESLSRSFASLRQQGVTVSRQRAAVNDVERLKVFVSDDEGDQHQNLAR
jgi:hypothetical protein